MAQVYANRFMVTEIKTIGQEIEVVDQYGNVKIWIDKNDALNYAKVMFGNGLYTIFQSMVFIQTDEFDVSGQIITQAQNVAGVIVAQENILAYEPVTHRGFKADSSNIAHLNQLMGLAEANINTGFSGVVVASGIMVNTGWAFTAGDKIFLNGSSLSTTPPSVGFIQKIGVAINATTINIEISQSVRI